MRLKYEPSLMQGDAVLLWYFQDKLRID